MKCVLVDYFSTILLRCDSHAIQFTDSKLAVLCVCVCFSIFTDICSNLQSIIKHFIISKGNPVSCDYHLFKPFVSIPIPKQLFIFQSLYFYFLVILCECSHKICDFFDYLIHHIVSRFICLVCISTSLLL